MRPRSCSPWLRFEMRMKHIVMAFLVCLVACTEQQPGSVERVADKKMPVVIATNYPLYFFTQMMAGNNVDVRFPGIEGDPAAWTPDGDAVVELQAADLIIINGAGYESWLSFVTLPEDILLDTTVGLAEYFLPMESSVHQHGPEGEHSHPGTAYTTWLDPLMAIEQARAIEQALSVLAPVHADDFRAGFTQLEARLQELDRLLQQAFAALQDQPVVFSHPVYQYLQNRYGINGHSVHWEPDGEPGVRAWIDFQNLLREHPARLVIWEDQPLPEVRARLEETGIHTIVFRPAGNRPEQGDYFSVMEANLLRLAGALSQLEK